MIGQTLVRQFLNCLYKTLSRFENKIQQRVLIATLLALITPHFTTITYALSDRRDSTIKSLPKTIRYADSTSQSTFALQGSGHTWGIKDLNFSSANSVADFLAEQGVFQLKETAGIGSPQSFIAQGLDLSRIQIIIDGVVVNDVNHRQDVLHQINTSSLVSLSFHPMGQNSTTAQSPVGGSLVLTTKTIDKTSLTGLIGSYSQSQIQSATNMDVLDTHLSFYLNAFYVKNDFEYLNHNNTVYEANDDYVTKQTNNEVTRYDGTLLSQHEFKDFSIHQKFQALTEKRGLAGLEENQTRDSFFEENILSYQLKFLQKKWSALLSHQYRQDEMYWTRADNIWYSPKLSQSWKNEFTNTKVALEHKMKALTKLKWDKGVSLKLSRSQPLLFPSRTHLKRTDFEQTGYGLQLGQSFVYPFNSIWSISHAHNYLMNIESAPQHRINKSNYFGGQLKLQFHPTDPHFLFFELSKLYQEVSIHDRFGLSPGLLPNPDLKPENIYKVTLGHRYYKNIDNQLYAYYLEDRIAYSTSSRSMPIAKNSGDLQNIGLETKILIPLHHNHIYKANLRFQQNIQLPRIQSDIANYQQNLPQEVSPYTMSSTWENIFTQRMRVFVQYIYHSEQWADIGNTQKLDEKHYLNTWLQVITMNDKLEFGVKNWLNTREYKIYQATPSPGRTWFLRYTHHFLNTKSNKENK